ncbi:MAG TPA: hypothetical protein ENN67_07810, partial [Firmicutes bacterium]|nr:hypothetical protein [Bacillota bacterium]
VDLYKITATKSGYMIFDLDIFTWGENLDLFVYDSPDMSAGSLLDASTGPNSATSSFESCGIACSPGETYYIKVAGAALGDSTAYGLSAREVENYIDIEASSHDPGFIHVGKNNIVAGNIDISVGFRMNINELIVSTHGSMPLENVTGIHLYRDMNGNKSLDGSDKLVASGDFHNTNRAIFNGFTEEIKHGDSPSRFFITLDIAGIDHDCDIGLALISYKDISTQEGAEVHYSRFPIFLDRIVAGVDSEPPSWNSTVGIQQALPQYSAALLRWNSATEPLTPPVKYNIYWTDELPFDFGTAWHLDNVSAPSGGGYDHQYKLQGLINDHEYYVAVRVEDQAGNEDQNEIYLSVTPAMISDPYNPQIVGVLDTPGSAWEVVCDPPNQRVFIAASSGGLLVVDVSNPTSPSLTAQIPGSNVHGVDFDGTYVYGASGNGLMVVDPDAPGGAALIGSLSGNYLDVCVVGDWVYLTGYNDQLKPADVSDPTNPVGYPSVDSGYYGYGMDAQDGYLFVSTYYRPRVYDISNPSTPVHKRTFGNNGSYEIDAIGNRLYVTYWTNNRVSIYNIADPTDPQYLGNFTSSVGSGGADIVMFNGYLYFGTNNHHIEVLNVDNPSNIIKLGQISTNGPDGLDTDGIFIYSAENEYGLKVIL